MLKIASYEKRQRKGKHYQTFSLHIKYTTGVKKYQRVITNTISEKNNNKMYFLFLLFILLPIAGEGTLYIPDHC